MPGNEITTGMRPRLVIRRQMEPAGQRLALERDHHRLDLVIGQRHIARVAVALALVVGEIGRVVVVVRPLRRAPMDRRHEIIVARGDRRAIVLRSPRLGFAATRGVGEGRLDIGVFLDALADRGEVGAALDAAGGVEIERARLVPVDADRTEHVVERPALRGPAPHLGFAYRSVRHHVLFPESLAAEQHLRPHAEEPAEGGHLEAWATIEIVAILRDAVLGTAPQDEVGV